MTLEPEFNEAADEWYSLEPGTYPRLPRRETGGLIAVRGLLPLPLLDTPGFQQRRDAIEAALLILSQSETARKFALVAIAAGYSIEVDPPFIHGADYAHEADAQACADHGARRIRLRGGDDPLALALAMAHELAHVSQIMEGGLDISVSTLHPLAAIRQLMAMEGDARAYEFLVACELAFRGDADPEERLTFPQAIDAVKSSIGISMAATLIDHMRDRLPERREAVMAGVFKCLYAAPSLRQHYEDAILHGIATLEREQPGTLKDPALFQGQVTAEALLGKLDGRGRPYALAHAAYLDLDSPAMTSVSDETAAQLEAFEKIRRENPATRKDAPWRPAAPDYASVATLRRAAAQKGPAP
jgi:hypothetical protein